METVAQKVKEIIAEQLGIEEYEIERDSSLADFNADSLDAVEIIMNLEDIFEVSIPDEDAQKLITVDKMIAYIEDKKKFVQGAT